jgi:hypothetical protein
MSSFSKHRTKGEDLTKFIDIFTNRVNAYAEWVTTWSDAWFKYVSEKNGFNKIVKACSKVNKTRAKAEANQLKDRVKAEAKAQSVAKAKAKAQAKAQAKQMLITAVFPERL